MSIDGIGVDPDKITLIENFPRPQTMRGVQSFYGLANYYRRAIASFAEIASSLSKLLKKLDTSISLVWDKVCEEAFLLLKKKLLFASVLVPSNWNEPFHVYVDASLIALGCVLSQNDTRNIDHPIYFVSRQLIATEKNYTTTEHEALGMIFAVQKFRHYLLDYPFIFYVDHDALKYLINKPDLSGQLACWILLLQEFNFTVVVCPGKSHGNANVLSRLQPTGLPNAAPLDDNLPNANLFEVDVIFPEYCGNINLLGNQSNSSWLFPTSVSNFNLAKCSLFPNWWRTVQIGQGWCFMPLY